MNATVNSQLTPAATNRTATVPVNDTATQSAPDIAPDTSPEDTSPEDTSPEDMHLAANVVAPDASTSVRIAAPYLVNLVLLLIPLLLLVALTCWQPTHG